MTIVETHAHVFHDAFAADLPEVIERARLAGVGDICMPNIDVASIAPMLEVRRRYPHCRAMIGLHPCYVKADFREQLDTMEKLLETERFIAIGEIGTDLHWDKTYWKEQQEAFCKQMTWACHYRLPAVIHCRESLDETLALLKPFVDQGVSGVFHCFTGSLEQAKKIADFNFYFGIGGTVTYKKSTLPQVLPHIDLSRIVLETDAPYLSPVPHRGKRNEPANIAYVVEAVAAIKNVTAETVAAVTTRNAQKLFNLL